MRTFKHSLPAFVLASVLVVSLPVAAGNETVTPVMMGMGDSIGEGVQSGDANTLTQPHSYLNLIANQMGAAFPLPLIQSGPTGVVGNTTGRSRIDATVEGANLAVSGADANSILNERSSLPVSTETDLVLLPRIGSQIEAAESSKPPLVVCWIGNNDVLGAILAFHHLDASQMTSATTFWTNYSQLVQRLGGMGRKVVLANIPDVTQISYLMNSEDLVRFLGNDYGLPSGSYTTVQAMLLIRMGVVAPSVLQNPDWVLDASEIQKIQDRTNTFNRIIAQQAAQAGMALVDINSLFQSVSNNPPVIGGITLTNRYLGGMFSLDGVHPSDIGHAVIANAFIQKINQAYGLAIPELTLSQLVTILKRDPFVDFDGDLVVQGRSGAGLLETLGPLLGISGDTTPYQPSARPRIDPGAGGRFMREYLRLSGRNPDTSWSTQDAVDALRRIFGDRK